MTKWTVPSSGDFFGMAEEFEKEMNKDNFIDECFDPVTKPLHYNTGGVECIDYIKQVLGTEGFIAYCHGNMIKYQHRHRYKNNPVEDMDKANWYMQKMREAMKEIHK